MHVDMRRRFGKNTLDLATYRKRDALVFAVKRVLQSAKRN